MRIKSLHPAEQLDYVMRKIRDIPNPNHWLHFDEFCDLIILSDTLQEERENHSQIDSILQKLLKDGFIDKLNIEHNNIPAYIYLLTFEGEALLDLEGGHKGRLSDKDKAQKHEKIRIDKLESENRANQHNTLVLTKILMWTGVVVAVMSLFQYLLSVKIQYPYFPTLSH